MEKLSNLRVPEGATHRVKRVGRGEGSGHGKTCCRGQKGQKSRSGARIKPWFEGGQMPLVRRLPKFGFRNTLFAVNYTILNLNDLKKIIEKTKKTHITINDFIEHKIIKKDDMVKILGDGSINMSITVEAHKFSKSAKRKIEEAGGKCIIVNKEKGKGKKES